MSSKSMASNTSPLCGSRTNRLFELTAKAEFLYCPSLDNSPMITNRMGSSSVPSAKMFFASSLPNCLFVKISASMLTSILPRATAQIVIMNFALQNPCVKNHISIFNVRKFHANLRPSYFGIKAVFHAIRELVSLGSLTRLCIHLQVFLHFQRTIIRFSPFESTCKGESCFS